MTELLILGDSTKVLKNTNSRPVSLYKNGDTSGDQGIYELGSQYTVPADKVLLITDIVCFSGNATSYMHCTLKDDTNDHLYWVLNQGDDPASSIAFKTSDIFVAGKSPVINSNHNGLTMILRGVEYNV